MVTLLAVTFGSPFLCSILGLPSIMCGSCQCQKPPLSPPHYSCWLDLGDIWLGESTFALA